MVPLRQRDGRARAGYGGGCQWVIETGHWRLCVASVARGSGSEHQKLHGSRIQCRRWFCYSRQLLKLSWQKTTMRTQTHVFQVHAYAPT